MNEAQVYKINNTINIIREVLSKKVIKLRIGVEVGYIYVPTLDYFI